MTAKTQFSEPVPITPLKAYVAAISENRGWFIALGILLIVVGMATIAFPFTSSIAIELITGVSLVVAGIGQMVYGFGNKKWGGFFLALIVGAIWFLAGVLLIARPLEGLAALTLVVAMAFIADGVIRTIFALRMRPLSGWGWVLFGGTVGILVGLMLWAQFPFTAVWALGVLAGVNILFSGCSTLMLVVAAGDAAGAAENNSIENAKTA